MSKPNADKKVSRRKFLAGAGGAVVAIAAAGGAYYYLSQAPTPPTSTTAATTAAQTTASGQLTVAVVGTMQGARWAGAAGAVAPAFEKKYPGADVLVSAFPSHDAILAKYTLELSNATGFFDVIQDSPDIGSGRFAANGWLEELTPYLQKPNAVQGFPDDFAPFQVKDEGMFNGKLYGIPWDGNVQLYYWRADMFADPTEQKNFKSKYGYDLAPSTMAKQLTWQQFFDVAQFFTRDSSPWANGGKLYGAAFPLTSGSWAGVQFEAIIKSWGGELWDDHYVPQFTSDSTVNALTWLTNLMPYMPPGVTNYTEDDIANDFDALRLAHCVQWGGPYLDRNIPKPELVGHGVIPAGPNGPTPYGGGFVLSIPVSSKHKEEAWNYIVEATSNDNMLDIVKAGGQPARLSALSNPDLNKIAPYLASISASWKVPGCWLIPTIPAWLEIDDYLGRMVSAAITGQKTPQQALADTQTESEKIMKNAGIYGKYVGTTDKNAQYYQLPPS